jgi:acetyltransferase-like isoleucine patch superfamily enzyme
MSIVLLDDCGSKFQPISYTTPTPFLITGGLRLVEHWMIRLRSSIGLYLYMSKEESLIHVRRNRLLINKFLNYALRLEEEQPSIAVSACVLPTSSAVNKVMDYVKLGVKVTCGERILVYGPGEIVEDCSLQAINGMWDLIKFNVDLLRETIQLLGKGDVVTIGSRIHSGLYLDTRNGPVAIIGSDLGDAISIKGPALIGPESEVQSFTVIRPGSVIYMQNTVGGEVKNSIMDRESRKPHHGYLGDSYMGKWINLGAGTSVSNLKNTLGPVRYMGHDTGMNKLGPVIGDWVRSGINTSIMTGKAIGPGSQVYGIVTSDIPPFIFYKNYGEPVMSIADRNKMIDIIRRATRDDEDEAALAALIYESTSELRRGIKQIQFRL